MFAVIQFPARMQMGPAGAAAVKTRAGRFSGVAAVAVADLLAPTPFLCSAGRLPSCTRGSRVARSADRYRGGRFLCHSAGETLRVSIFLCLANQVDYALCLLMT